MLGYPWLLQQPVRLPLHQSRVCFLVRLECFCGLWTVYARRFIFVSNHFDQKFSALRKNGEGFDDGAVGGLWILFYGLYSGFIRDGAEPGGGFYVWDFGGAGGWIAGVWVV